jgi:hypothetical protein
VIDDEQNAGYPRRQQYFPFERAPHRAPNPECSEECRQADRMEDDAHRVDQIAATICLPPAEGSGVHDAKAIEDDNGIDERERDGAGDQSNA